jgi:hypothetical protein
MSKRKTIWRWGILLLAAGGLSGCESDLRISKDYGVAVRQDVAAQIADPDAHYTGVPQPGSDSTKVASAQQRYVSGHVIQPASTSTSTVSTGGGGGGGGGGDSGGGGGGAPSGQ